MTQQQNPQSEQHVSPAATDVNATGKRDNNLIKIIFGATIVVNLVVLAIFFIFNNGGISARSYNPSDATLLRVLDVSYSNSLAPQGNNTYVPWNMLDGNAATAWAVNLNNPAIYDCDKLYGPMFKVHCKKLSHIVIRNGYGKSTSAFINNSRAARVRFITFANDANDCGDNEVVLFEGPLRDDPTPQRLNIPLDLKWNNDITTVWMVFDTYTNGGIIRGAKWNDLCISEIEFWGFE